MAKRKRLTLPSGIFPDETAPLSAGTEPKPALSAPFGAGAAPIARVAADAATSAAFEAVSDELRRARVEGRLVQSLPLASVMEDYLVRDRIAAEDEELAALMESLEARGQQTPIEVVDLGQGRYGLISGWRRLTALRRLQARAGEPRFDTVLALLRRPAESSDAYVAMVEENEVRVGLSYYERARIVAKAVEQGVFGTRKQALQTLFASASRAKRSKIGSFLTIVAALDPVLRHPARLGERTGLALAQALEADPALGPRLAQDLAAVPAVTAEAEQARLASALRPPLPSPAPSATEPSATDEAAPGISVRLERTRLTLTGPGVDARLHARLLAWLSQGEA